MKTNVILHSIDRELFGIKVKQQTKNQMLSVTDLQNAYEKARWIHGWSDRRISDILQYQSVQERVYHLLNEQGIIKTSLPVFMQMVKNEGVTKVMKGLGLWVMSGRGENRSVYADPYIWILLAMEMNPMLYAKVILWLTDSLIFDRLEAGSEYLPMNTAIKSVVASPNYHVYAKTINEAVFGFHQAGMRNLCSAAELRRITNIEKFVINAIQMGFVKSESDIVRAIKQVK